MDWEEYVTEIASDIMKEQSPRRFGESCILFSCIALRNHKRIEKLEDHVSPEFEKKDGSLRCQPCQSTMFKVAASQEG
ncbi:hypothetical protein Hdeb2414_s0045g00745001 [Helianthus debilis subsp. tardiflorus]